MSMSASPACISTLSLTHNLTTSPETRGATVVMYPSTCASSVVISLPKKTQETSAKTMADAPETIEMRFQSRTTGRVGGCTIASAFFASAGSIAPPLMCIDVLSISCRPSKVRTVLVVPIEGLDFVIAGARQFVLGGDDINICGHNLCESTLRPRNLLLREIECIVCDRDSTTRCPQLLNRGAHLLQHGVRYVAPLLGKPLLLKPGLSDLGRDSTARPKREV